MSDSKALTNYEHYVYARDHGHRDFVRKATKCEKFVYGEQWDDDVAQRLRNQNKPVLTINQIFSSLMVMNGEQITSAADVSFLPTASGNPDTAKALNKLWLHIAKTNKLKWIEEEVFNAGAIASRAYFDVRMDFDDQMRGDIRITRPHSKNVVLPPDGDDYDSEKWNEVFVTYWLTPQDIELIYGKADVAKELKNRTRSYFKDLGYDSIDNLTNVFGENMSLGHEYNFRGMYDNKVRRFIRVVERQHRELSRKPHFVDRITGEMRVIPENWERERIQFAIDNYDLGTIDKKTSIMHWSVSAEEFMLHDEESPYDCVTIIPYFPYFHDGKTVGLIENLLSPQELLNKTSSQELHIVNTTANSGWKLKAGSLTNMTPEELEERGAETGLVMELNDINNAEKITPNTVPTGLDRIAFKAREDLKEISGISDSKRGFDRADVAAKAILAKQRAGSINLTVPFNNLIRTRHMLAKKCLKLIQTYYTEERAVTVVGNSLGSQPETVSFNQLGPNGEVLNDLTLGEYDVVVTDVPSRDNFEDTIFSEAVQLRELGVAIPDDVLVETSHLPNKAEVAQRIKDLQGGGEATEAQQQMEQLELQLKQLEAEEKAANILTKKAQAALDTARAQKEMAPEGENDLAQIEIEAQKLVMERENQAAELELDRQRIEAELRLKRDELREKMEIERERLRQQFLVQRAQLSLQKEQQEKKDASSNDKK
ncbi:MAG: hypothetical protein GTN99_08035 [Candidatus Dadabacteria bacterium]|nr:hypothetical protein [Candidatus Dadabacteria bacterium]